MGVRAYRAAITVAAAGVVVAALWGVMVTGGNGVTGAAADTRYTIEVNEKQFNPRTCIVNRNDDEVVFKNVGTQVHRVVVDDAGVNSPFRLDTGDIQPGQTSEVWLISANANIQYYDFYNPEMRGTIIAPISNGAAANCAKETPTPTPTLTPTPSPTRTPTPVPTPIQKPPRCIGLEGCAVAPQVARD